MMRPRYKKDTESTNENIGLIDKSRNSEGETSDLPSSGGVQCEMGMETFRKYWTPLDEGADITGLVSAVPSQEPVVDEAAGPVKNVEETDSSSGGAIDIPTDLPEVQIKMDLTSCGLPAVAGLNPNNPDGVTTMFIPVVVNAEGTAIVLQSALPVLDNRIPVLEGQPSEVSLFESASVFESPVPTLQIPFPVLDDAVPAVGNTSAGTPNDNVDNLQKTTSNSHPKASNQKKPQSKKSEKMEVSSSDNISEALICGDCKKGFIDAVAFVKHCKGHNAKEPFKCLDCPKRFKHKYELQNHALSHPGKVYTCDKCKDVFVNNVDYVNHRRTHDEDPLPVASPIQVAEKTKSPLGTHDEQFACSQCEKAFADPDLLKHHEFTHTEGEIFPCDECGSTFRDEASLGTHLRQHRKTQKCEECGEFFTNIFDFNEHMAAHKQWRKVSYSCVHCGMTFNSFNILKKHVALHGLDVICCGDCGGSGQIGVEEEDDEDDLNENDSPERNPMLVSNENSVVRIAAKAAKQRVYSGDEDPLKLDENVSVGDLIDNSLGEQIEIEMHVEDVLIKEECVLSDNEAVDQQTVSVKENAQTKSKKRNSSETSPKKRSRKKT